jgi:hypothetical protein
VLCVSLCGLPHVNYRISTLGFSPRQNFSINFSINLRVVYDNVLSLLGMYLGETQIGSSRVVHLLERCGTSNPELEFSLSASYLGI